LNKATQEAADAQKVLEDATKDAATAALSASDAMAQIARQRNDLEIQLLEAQGKTEEATARKRADILTGLDASLAPLQNQIWGVQDANEAAKIAAEEADKAQKLLDDSAKAAQQAQQQAQQDATKAAQQAAEQQIKSMEAVHDSISSALKSMMGESEVFAMAQRAQAKETLARALQVAKAGGTLVGFAGLDEAVASIGKLDKNNFASALGYNAEFGQSVGLLSELEKYTRVNGSHEAGLERVPFNGYVAQLHAGERVQTASQAAASDSNVVEMRAMREEIKAGQIAMAVSLDKIAKLQQRWDGNGMPEVRAQ